MVANLQDIQNIYGRIPDEFTIGGERFDNYTKFTELHYKHGWREVVEPIGEVVNDVWVLINDKVTKE